MALQIAEAWESGSGELGKESSDHYSAIIWGSVATDGADDPYTVTTFASNHFSLISPFGNVLNKFNRKRIGIGSWMFEAEYKSPTNDRQTNDASFSFTTGGGTQHITHSRSTVLVVNGQTAAGSPTVATSFMGGIGVTDTSVEGVDIHVSSFDFKATFYLPPAKVTSAYVTTLKSSTSCVNSNDVAVNIDGVEIDFAPGELLLLGAEGSKRHGFSDWEFTTNWSAQCNRTSFNVGPVTVSAKKGWDYLWVSYLTDVDTGSNAMTQSVKGVYIEQVYAYTDLNGIIPASAFGQSNTQPWANPALTSGGGLS